MLPRGASRISLFEVLFGFSFLKDLIVFRIRGLLVLEGQMESREYIDYTTPQYPSFEGGGGFSVCFPTLCLSVYAPSSPYSDRATLFCML